MSDTIQLFVLLAAQGAFAFVLMKVVPAALLKFVDKEIERRSDVKLEQVKGEIQGAYSTLKASVDVLTASNSGLQSHIIESVSSVWNLMVAMRHQYAGLVTFDTIILADEAVAAFQNPAAHQFLHLVRPYEDAVNNPVGADMFFASGLDKHRLFCGDRLWLIFYVSRAVLMRNAMLISESFRTNEYQDWRKDKGIQQLLTAVLKDEFTKKVIAFTLNGLSTAMAQLEAEFLHEATRVMSGSKAVADSLADVQAVMLLENAKIAASK